MINADQQFPEMMKRVENAISRAFPIESKRHVMDVRNLRWKNFGPSIRDNIRLQKEFKNKDKTLSADLVGDVRIRSRAGRVVDTKPGMVLVTLPHITNRASYIVNGHEVQTVNQLRLRPGPYSRFTSDDNTETFINAAGGGYKIIFNRQTGVLRLKSGSSFFYLYPILKSLGVTDAQMKSAWGGDIFTANKAHDKSDQVTRLYRNMRPYAEIPEDPEELSTAVDTFFRSKQLDPKISKITMGKEYDRISPDLLLRSSGKAIDLAKGSVEMDDTESLAFKSIHSVEDFIPERIEKAIPSVKRAIQFKMDRAPKISSLLSPASFSNPVIDWFITSEFTRYSDQQNPVDMASTSQLTTTMGEGGIRSAHAVTDQVRMVHPSQMGFLDPIHSPEGGRIGVTGHLTIGAEKKGDSLYTKVIDAKTGRQVSKSAQDLENAVIAFNDQYDLTGDRPRPLKPRVEVRAKGKIQIVPASQVEYVFRDPRSFFSVTSNAIPFLHNNNPNRGQMADRHIEQTVPLTDPDSPVVQSKFQGKEGFDDFFGRNVSIQSPVDGTVTLVRNDRLKIRGDDGKMYLAYLHYQYPLNGGSFLTDRPTVKAGDRVKKGQVIAENNFSKGGALALGKTLRTAYVPYKGYNFEDGVVISQAAARKLTSEHQYQLRLDIDRNTRVGLDIFLAHFPDEIVNIDRAKYDRDGIVRKGSRVTKDEILVPAVSQTEVSEEFDYARLHKSLKKPWRNASIVWESDFPGEVVDVVKTSKFIKVFLRTEEAAQVGDKVSQRSGGKGIIVNILPDNEMLQGEDGKPVDVLFNPGGVTGRVNPGQLYEASMGKVSRKTGEKYLVENFSPESSLDRVQAEMRKAGVKDTETLTDPGTGNKINDIFTGDIHFLKLQHQVRNKFKARGLGSYTTDEQPSKVGKESAQNIGSGELYALLASGAMHFLKDTTTLKSQSNPEYWRALQTGLPTPPPQQPFILDKFVTSLEGAGVNLAREGSKVKALPMTDKDVESRSRGEIKNFTVVRASDLKPEAGGLFDKGITGGYDGVHWAHIDLETPMPSPLMEKALIAVAGLKPAEYKSIMRGTLFVTRDGHLTTDSKKGAPAGEGLKILLDKVNVERDLEDTISQIRIARGSRLDDLNKKRRYLQALKSSKLTPSEAYITSKVPVIPPKFRPVYPLPDGSLNVADPNHGYREVLMINNQLKALRNQGVDNRNLASMRADLYGALQGLTGMTEPLTRAKNFRGFVSTIKGRSNKRGLFQGKVVKRPQDLSGRSTVIPDPNLGIDEVGLPADMALTIYKPFLVRRLVGMGYKPTEAMDLVDKKDPKVLDILKDEAAERPVWMNRAPSLHKFSMLPFRPRIAPGKAIQVNPLIVKGFNMDFNGDSCSPDTVVYVRRVSDRTLFVGSFDEFVKNELLPGIDDAGLEEIAGGVTGILEFADSAYEVLGLFEGKIAWQPLNQITIHTSHGPCFEVSFKSGDTLICSEHHNLFGVDPDTLDLFTFKTEKHEEYPDVVVPIVSLWDSEPVGNARIPALDSGRRLDTVPVDDDLAWWTGVYVGEGSLTGRNDIVSCSSSDPEMLGQIKIAMERIGPVWETDNQVRITSKDLFKAFESAFGKGSQNKKFPDFVFEMPPALRLQAVVGFLDAEAQAAFDINGRPFLTVELTSLQALRQVSMLMRSVGIRSSIREGRPEKTGRKKTWILYVEKSGFGLLPNFRSKSKKEWQAKVRNFSEISRSRMDMVPMFDSVFSALTKKGLENRTEDKKTRAERRAWAKEYASSHGVPFGPVSKSDLVGHSLITRRAAFRIAAWYGPFEKDSLLDKWRSLVENTSVSYTEISCREIDRLPILYDFSVPPNEAFVVNSGIVTHNTVGIHVPVSEEARQEAFQKLPSKQLLSVREQSAVHTPSKEYVLGLYLMTHPKGKTVTAKSRTDMMAQYQAKKIKVNTPVKIGSDIWTPGQALVDDVFPVGLKPGNRVMDKRTVETLLFEVARKEPNKAGDVISRIKDLGAHFVTEIGYSFGLEDLKFDYKKREQILDEAEKKTPKIGFEKAYGQALDKMNSEIRKTKGNRVVEGSITSGAFGKADMVTQMIATPVAVRDHKNEIIPVPIKRSFAEGHGISSYWATAPGARKGLIEKGLGTAETGALSKRLINTTVTQTISMKDCGTTEGTLMPIESRDALDHFVADGPFKKEAITSELVTQMKRRGLKQVLVRSPLKCEAPQGVCAMCFGLLENGKVPPIGYNVGVLSGQAVSEPMTQLTLRAFHTGGAMAQKAVGFDRIKQIFELPENLPGRAPLAQTTGKVESIDPAPGGGWIVVIGGVDHFVPQERGLGVKRGDRVLAGQQISKTGVIRPQELLAATNDIDKVRGQMVKDLNKEFGTGGVHIQRKLLETVVRPMTDRAEVTDAGDGEKKGYFKGDVVAINKLEKTNKEIRKAGGKPIEYQPTLLSIRVAPYHSGDFIGKLMFERPHETISAAPRIGAEADVVKGHPITRHTFGRYFGARNKK
jgi:DNA-directed RNA polymerase beta subunit/DNA-directed RNA polymerase beta' subunit